MPPTEVADRTNSTLHINHEEDCRLTALSADDFDDSSDGDSDEEPGRQPPLPTKEIEQRKTTEYMENRVSYDRRRTSVSLASFTSDSSVSSDPDKITQVGDLRFLNDADMPEGESSILGKGAFAMVRLARRHKARRLNSQISTLSMEGTAEHDHEPEATSATASTHGFTKSFSNPQTPPAIPNTKTTAGTTTSAANKDDKHNNNNSNNINAEEDTNDKGVLVAVKIFEKSLLEKCRTIERDSTNHQMQVRTALENVEREIAVMKMIQHPNLASLYEVIDTGSNRLYMVLEYVPLGEIMTNVSGTGMYKRRPPRKGRRLKGVNKQGYFEEHQAALYFVDIMHGLAHLHKNHIVHRDLKPENILLDSRGFAKISDFGVAHLFEDEMKSAGRSSLSDSYRASDHKGIPSARISRSESDAALKMKSMSDMGKLTRTEGTWCFWSPEMCAENSLVFSGYACDIWAAGVCLYIFATGKLPFYTDIPMLLFDKIAEANLPFDDVKLSNDITDMLKKVLTKDPSSRAGVGDCLMHPYCKRAREQRVRELGEGVEMHEEVIVHKEDLRKALSVTKGDRRGSLHNLAYSVGEKFSWLRNQLPGSQTSQRSLMSIDDDSVTTEGRRGSMANVRRQSSTFKSAPHLFWRSQKTMSMGDCDSGSRAEKTRRRWTAFARRGGGKSSRDDCSS